MRKTTDGRVLRGQWRRRAWKLVAEAIVSSGALERREENRLTHDTLAEILAFTLRRARGLGGPPPGGVRT